jgi:hypothetical protein
MTLISIRCEQDYVADLADRITDIKRRMSAEGHSEEVMGLGFRELRRLSSMKANGASLCCCSIVVDREMHNIVQSS